MKLGTQTIHHYPNYKTLNLKGVLGRKQSHCHSHNKKPLENTAKLVCRVEERALFILCCTHMLWLWHHGQTCHHDFVGSLGLLFKQWWTNCLQFCNACFRELHHQVGKTYTDYKKLSSYFKITCKLYVRKTNGEINTKF